MPGGFAAAVASAGAAAATVAVPIAAIATVAVPITAIPALRQPFMAPPSRPRRDAPRAPLGEGAPSSQRIIDRGAAVPHRSNGLSVAPLGRQMVVAIHGARRETAV